MDAVIVEKTGNISDKPLQIVSYAEKYKNKQEWFRANIDHYIHRSTFGGLTSEYSSRDTDLQVLYGVYNNEFPLSWFSHITDPLSAKEEKHKAFPAKIRPVTILRSNIDLLLGEYPRRPFVYNVQNIGETGYNRYMEQMRLTAQKSLTNIFINEALQSLKEQGQQLSPEQLQQLEQQPPIPEEVKAEFISSYKDIIAIKGQKWLKRIIRESEVRQKQHKMFKDWLIVGEGYSYKSVENGKIVYKRISPLSISYDQSMVSEFVEDAEWVVCREWWTLSEITDRFYHSLKQVHHEKLQNDNLFNSPQSFYSQYRGLWAENFNKIPVYHVQWKGYRKVGFLTYFDPVTFQVVEEEVDEDYVPQEGEQVDWREVMEVYEGWRIKDDLYCDMGPVMYQSSDANNLSKHKLSYNGRRHSDTHSTNLSVLKMGIPFQIMYIILNYTLEKTIAKSKGKILLIDEATVPKHNGWTEEKFFYWAEAKGYALLNRNQVGVDKSWNQYQVLDMTLFDSIKQLIELMDYYKSQWDDLIGVTRQRKGQTYASDGQGVNERAVFQSTIITDMMFIGFEELVERDLQGLLNLAKFATIEGDYKLYNEDEYFTQVLSILPEDFAFEDLGIFVNKASEELRKLQEMRGYAQAMLQNNQKASTVMEVIDAVNISELKQKLKQVEAIDEQVQKAMAESEQEAAQALEESKQRFVEFSKLLDRENMEAEYDRKEDIEYIRGSFNTFTFQNGDVNANNVPDTMEVQKLMDNRKKAEEARADRLEQRKLQREQFEQKKKEFAHKQVMDKKNLAVKKSKNKSKSK